MAFVTLLAIFLGVISAELGFAGNKAVNKKEQPEASADGGDRDLEALFKVYFANKLK